MKLIKDLTDRDIIHCPTEEICRIVGNLINNRYGENWKIYNKDMALVGKPSGVSGMYSSVDYFNVRHKDNYIIYDGQEFINFNTKLNYLLW